MFRLEIHSSELNERGEKTVLVFIIAHNFHSSTHNVERKKVSEGEGRKRK